MCTVKPPKREHFGTVAFVLSLEVALFLEVAFFASKPYAVCLKNILVTLCYKCMNYYANFTVMIYIERYCT